MSPELQSLIVLVSAVSGGMAFLSGIIFYVMTLRYAQLMKTVSGLKFPKKLGVYSLIIASIAIALGMFLLYRMGMVANTGVDFGPSDWLLFDFLVGAQLFLSALWCMEDFKFRFKTIFSEKIPPESRLPEDTPTD